MEIIKTHLSWKRVLKKAIAALNLELKRLERGIVIIECITEFLQSCQSSLKGGEKKNVNQVYDAWRLYFFVTFAVNDCGFVAIA